MFSPERDKTFAFCCLLSVLVERLVFAVVRLVEADSPRALVVA